MRLTTGATGQKNGTNGIFVKETGRTETKLATTQMESLAVGRAVLILCPNLGGSRFNVKTDQKALKWLLKMTRPTGKLAWRRLLLLKHDFDVAYRAGAKHHPADVLLGLKAGGDDTETLDGGIPVITVFDHG